MRTKWTGLWPGSKECYDNKLITYWWVPPIRASISKHTLKGLKDNGVLLISKCPKDLNPDKWSFDLNTYTEKKMNGKL